MPDCVKTPAEALTLLPATARLHRHAASPSLGRRCPHNHPAPQHSSATSGPQPWHLDEVQPPPEVVRQDGHTARRPHLLQPSHQAIARLPPPFPGPTRVLPSLRALLHHLRPAAHALLHGLQQGLSAPPGHPPPPLTAPALRLERTAAAG